jgi:acetyltransferase-like isoleucine patch superfamily enzyme
LVVGRSRNPPAVTLGDRVAIGPYVTFVTASDPKPSILLHHPELRNAIVDVGPITVEPDAWIGAGVVVLPNVTIGRGSVVGSGAVVTRDVPPFTIVTGIPARPTRSLTPPDDLAPAGSGGDRPAIRDRLATAHAG